MNRTKLSRTQKASKQCAAFPNFSAIIAGNRSGALIDNKGQENSETFRNFYNQSEERHSGALFSFRLAIQQSSDRLLQFLGKDRLFQVGVAADSERLFLLRIAGVG